MLLQDKIYEFSCEYNKSKLVLLKKRIEQHPTHTSYFYPKFYVQMLRNC